MAVTTDWTDGTRAHRVVVREVAPEEIATPDYADAFAVTRRPDDARSPETLAREALEGAPRPIRAIILIAWRILGFRLGPLTSPTHVLGWSVTRSDPRSIELAAEGGRASSRIVIRDDGREAVVTTFLALPSHLSRLSWILLSPVHRRMARYLVDRTMGVR